MYYKTKTYYSNNLIYSMYSAKADRDRLRTTKECLEYTDPYARAECNRREAERNRRALLAYAGSKQERCGFWDWLFGACDKWQLY